MMLSIAASAAFALMGAAGVVDSVRITVVTGEDDLRGDSSAIVALETARGHKTTGLAGHGNGLPARSPRTVTIAPPPDTTIEDLQQVGIFFHSGKATGFDDHWTVEQVKVEAVVGGRTRPVYTSGGPPTKLMYTQEWRSPFFPTTATGPEIQAGEFWAELEFGSQGARRMSEFLFDFDLEDGRGFVGARYTSQLDDQYAPGVRASTIVSDRFPIHAIRQVRVGFRGGSEQLKGSEARSVEGTDNCDVRSIRFYYRGKSGEKLLFATFPEVNHRFPEQSWWQSPRFRPFKRDAGKPVGAMKVEVLTGRDDLRRAELNESQSRYYNSRIDLWFNVPIARDYARLPWLMKSEWVRGAMQRRLVPIQERDGFPDGWTGRYSAYGRFTKIATVEGEPILLPADLFGVAVEFSQGRGGDFRVTEGHWPDGLINLLRQPDNWDFAGIIVSTAPNVNGPWRRVYSDLALNQYMTRDGQQWRSRQFESAILRTPPH